MASNRISAAQKDQIKKAYSEKIKAVEETINQRGDFLVKKKLEKLTSCPYVDNFIKACKDLKIYVEENDANHDFIHYQVNRTLNDIVDCEESVFKKSSYHGDYVRMFPDDKEIIELSSMIDSLRKECNRIIWHIEMSPKTSKDYKNAILKAEELIFGSN